MKGLDILFTIMYNQAMGQTTQPKRQRNKIIINLYNSDGQTTMAEIARMFHISRQRVSQILLKYKAIRECQNCYHYKNGFCSCREAPDMIPSKNKCPDWIAKE